MIKLGIGDKVRRKPEYIDTLPWKDEWDGVYTVTMADKAKGFVKLDISSTYIFDSDRFDLVERKFMFKTGDYVYPSGDISKPTRVIAVSGDTICLHSLGWFNARDFTPYIHELVNMVDQYKTVEGYPVRVLATDFKQGSQQPLLVAVSIPNNDHESLLLLRDNGLDSNFDQYLFKVNPYEDFKVDEKVEVSNNGEDWVKGHFAGVSTDGKPQTFKYGKTQFTGGNILTNWSKCRKYDETAQY